MFTNCKKYKKTQGIKQWQCDFNQHCVWKDSYCLAVLKPIYLNSLWAHDNSDIWV